MKSGKMKPLASSKIPSYYTVHSSDYVDKKSHAFTYHPSERRSSSGYNYRSSQASYDPSMYRGTDYQSDESDESLSSNEIETSRRLRFNREGISLNYHLPLHSERVIISKDPELPSKDYYSKYSQEYYLSAGSQRQLRQTIERTVDHKYSKVERIIHAKLLKPVFHHWKDHDPLSNRSKIRQHMKYYYPIIKDDHSKEWYQHRACSIIMKYLFFQYSSLLFKKFNHWKCIYKEEYWMKRHFLDKWIIKTSTYKLARLTARRFVTIIYPIIRKYLLYLYIHHWKLMIERWKHYRYLRMVFRIWKLSIFAYKKYKKQQCRRAIGKLIANISYYKNRDSVKLQYLMSKVKTSMLNRVFLHWKQLRQKIGILKKFFVLITKKRMFLRCWNQWKGLLAPKIMSPPKYSSSEPASPAKTMIRAVYQNPTGANEYRQVKVSKKKKHHKLDWKNMTALERLEYRLRLVKRMDSKFEQIEHDRHEAFRVSLENVSFQNHQAVSVTSSQEAASERENRRSSSMIDPRSNILCRHSHDNCLYCNYCYRDDDSSTSTMSNFLEERRNRKIETERRR